MSRKRATAGLALLSTLHGTISELLTDFLTPVIFYAGQNKRLLSYTDKQLASFPKSGLIDFFHSMFKKNDSCVVLFKKRKKSCILVHWRKLRLNIKELSIFTLR